MSPRSDARSQRGRRNPRPSPRLGEAENFGGVALGGSQGEEVSVVTLDSLGLSQLRLLKVDVEGMEFEVVTGARETIGRLNLRFTSKTTAPNARNA